MRGRDLPAPGAEARDAVAESVDRRQLMLRRGRWKLIRSDRDSYYTDAFAPRRGTLELYDLATDPGERTNLAATRLEIVAELSAALDAWERQALVAAPPALPVDELRALGYLP
jgi:arylsulfatase A-like enzyme